MIEKILDEKFDEIKKMRRISFCVMFFFLTIFMTLMFLSNDIWINMCLAFLCFYVIGTTTIEMWIGEQRYENFLKRNSWYWQNYVRELSNSK